MAAKLVRIGGALAAFGVSCWPAYAQHAADNPVASANDAFGLTLGLETIGMYNPSSIRGFNPQVAGNVRVDGLYFDQQGGLSNRVVEGSTIRVGVSAIGYAFPAPTGIVDYDLRHPGDGTPSTSVVAMAGPFAARGFSVDSVLPIGGKDFELPIGAGYQISSQTTYSANPGYKQYVSNVGATPQWTINDRWSVRAILDWTKIEDANTVPFVFTGGDYFPPRIPANNISQDWAKGRSGAENYGAIVHGQLSDRWQLSAGLFRSVSNNPVSFSDLYLNTQPNGAATHVVIGYPDQVVGSTSGEIKLSGQMIAGDWRHNVVFSIRGRDTHAFYGGSDAVDLGPGQLEQVAQAPEPAFQYSGRTSDRGRLFSTGVAWRGQWQGRGEFALGVQREDYDKSVAQPGVGASHLRDTPLRSYAQVSYALSERVTAYAGGTQGLEDSGSAPTGATNHGMVLPAARTWQVDAGARYVPMRDLKVIAGVFEIEKPYFNLDSTGDDRQLAVQRARGIELSVSGALGPKLHLTAGALLGEVQVEGPGLSAIGIGPFAFGQPHFQTTINADYAFTQAFSADVTYFRFGTAPASLDDKLQQEPQWFYAIGARYRFAIDKMPATLRVQAQNLNNYYLWNFAYTPGFVQFGPRALIAYLTVDI
jgi:iron complex outermembrane recepter protein